MNIFLKIILLLPLPLQPQHVESFLLSHGIKAKVQIVDLATPLVLGEQDEYLYKLKSAFRSSRKTNVHILTDVFMDELGTKYILGVANSNYKIGYSVWSQSNVIDNWIVFAHEFGHNRNLHHSYGCKDLMDAKILSCANRGSLTFSPRQRSIIKRKGRRWKK